MAPPRLYEPPNEQLRCLLLEARALGLSFDEAWECAIRPRKAVVMTTTADPPAGAVRWPTDRNDRLAWQAAIRQTRVTWKAMYERRPVPRCVQSVTILLGLLVPEDAPGHSQVAA